MIAPSWRVVVVIALAGWASFLSLESWVRPGGFSTDRGLPQELNRGGALWRQRPPAPSAGPLPAGVVVLEGADYDQASQTPPAGPPPAMIRLRRLGLVSSGTGVDLPVEAIGQAVIGSGAEGRCVVLDAEGTILSEQPTAAAWLAWIAPQRPSPLQTVAWLAGLRPYRANGCLWESLPR